MKILLAAGVFPPDAGGPAIHAQALSNWLTEKGAQCKVVAFSKFRKYPAVVRNILYLFALLRNVGGVDIVYAYDAVGIGIPALIITKLFRKKVVVRIGGDLPWERSAEKGLTTCSMIEWYNSGKNRYDPLYRISSFTLKYFDAVILPTSMLSGVYINYYRVSPQKVYVIENPLPEVSDVGIVRGTDIIFASRLVAYKNLYRTIRVASKVLADHPNIRFVIYGDGPERERLEGVISRISRDGSVVLAGRVSQDEVIKKTQSCMFGIAPALTEFNPNYILQCVSCGKPFLISKENGLPFNTPDEFVFDARDDKEFETKLRNLLTDDGYAKALQLVQNIDFKMSWEDTLSRNFSVIESLL